MLVYHGTSLKHWKVIQKTGLKVRGKSKKSNWTHSIESNPNTVYMSDAYAMYFAISAIDVDQPHKDHAVIIEMDTDMLPGILVPDEDALEQASRLGGNDGLPCHWTMQERTRYYRGRTQDYAAVGLDFEWSMGVLGTGGHIGPIPPQCFKRVAIIDIREARDLTWKFMDCSVHVQNYRFCGPMYRNLNRRIFGIDQLEMDPLNIGRDVEVGPGIKIIDLEKK